jgi:hypothetical protein
MTCQLISNLTDLFDPFIIIVNSIRSCAQLFAFLFRVITNHTARKHPLSQLDQSPCFVIGCVCVVTIVLRCHVCFALSRLILTLTARAGKTEGKIGIFGNSIQKLNYKPYKMI